MDALTIPVVTENVVDADPLGTVTDAGTLAAAVFELERETTAPPDPAFPVIVMVPTPVCPLIIVLGLTERLLSASVEDVVTVSAKVLLVPAYDAVSMALVERFIL